MESGEYKRFESYYGVINLVRTRRFQALMDRLGANRISRPAGWILLYLMPVAAAIGFYLFLFELSILLSPRGAAVISYVRSLGPLANLGLPGINPYLPIVDGWIALVIAMIIHEGAHGIVARSLGLPVKASGLIFFLFVPIGAFVDVDEIALKTARESHSARVLAAGAGVNLVLGVACLLLLLSLVSAMTPAVNGIAISQVSLPSPASKAGIIPGDFIVAVNGIPYNDGSQFANTSWYRAGQNVSVTIWRHGTEIEVPLMVGARSNVTVSCENPMTVSLSYSCKAIVSDFLGKIEGKQISFGSNGAGTFNSTSCTISGNSCGVIYTPSSTQGSPQTITATFNGTTYNLGSLGSVGVTVENPGQTAATSTSSAGSAAAARDPASALSSVPGYIGINTLSNAALKSVAATYSSPLQNPWQYVCIPTLPTCQPRVPFSDALSALYTSPLGPATSSVANLVYWIFFLNFNLAIFNALPIYPLDGGQAFLVGVKALGRGRLSEKAIMRITGAATLAVVALILGVLAGPYIL
jgi:membrane-associated protease RseP (regulator of RpoE activity)